MRGLGSTINFTALLLAVLTVTGPSISSAGKQIETGRYYHIRSHDGTVIDNRLW